MRREIRSRRRWGQLGRLTLAPLLWIWLGPAWATGQDQTQDEAIRVRVDLVLLRFTVRDPGNRLVNTLTQEDFRVIQGGREREIVFFRPPRKRTADLGRLWIAFLLDVSGSTFATRAEEIMAAQNFLDNIHLFTQIGVFGFTDKLLVFQEFTSRKQLAEKAFAAARPHQGRTAIYESVEALLAPLGTRARPGDGKVLILVSDGMDDAYHRAERAAARALREDVRIYTILVPSATALPTAPGLVAAEDPKEEEKAAAFARLAVQTGGMHFSGIETILDFDSTLAQINDDVFGNLYSIGISGDPTPGIDPDSPAVVTASNPKLLVSRPFTRAPGRLRAKKKFIEALFYSEVELGPPEDEGLERYELGADVDILRPRGQISGKVGLPFRIKISPYTLSREPDGDVRTQLGIIGQLVDADGREVVRMREFFRATLERKELRDGRGIIYTNKLFVQPGRYNLRLALLEIPTWKMFFFQRDVRVSPPALSRGSRGRTRSIP
ncbi:MAG: VWA domain-containing protein [Candidatus Aminicenantes bacterium]|nr:VWA domain-containing protein [Candidatus Aminicenantes bacterium]